jgi:hypothetical protein
MQASNPKLTALDIDRLHDKKRNFDLSDGQIAAMLVHH